MKTFNQDRTSYFLDQSARDSPCRVRFAGEASLMSVSKWGGKATLDFAPGGDHGGEIEVHGNELLLKPEATPKAYHVFRKLDGERFEYDVLLLKEPDENIITIELDFPDGLEFFKQPSMDSLLASRFRCPPEVVDSYAVYWKERNGTYKTGKFCHIYRPLIRDARGRTVWGQLDITGHLITITIPELWLADAAYPVVVDPIIGTQTRGALNRIDWYNEDNPTYFYIELGMAFTRFTATTPISGTCTSYLYSYDNEYSTGRAVLFSESGGLPYARLSRNEQLANFQCIPAAWIPSTFTVPTTIPSGTPFWYGYDTKDSFYTYYDAIGTFRRMDTEAYSTIPDYYNDQVFEQTWSVLMSAYFEYSVSQALNRSLFDTAGLTETFGKRFSFKRTCVNVTEISETKVVQKIIPRLCADSLLVTVAVSRIERFYRFLTEAITCVRESFQHVNISRLLADGFNVTTVLDRLKIMVLSCVSYLSGSEHFSTLFDLRRILQEEVATSEFFTRIQTLFRYCTTELFTIGTLMRRVGCIRILIDWIGMAEQMLNRMLLKKEEVIIVSRITREIEFGGNLL